MIRALALRRITVLSAAPHALSAAATAAVAPVCRRLYNSQSPQSQHHQPQRPALCKRIYLAPHERLEAEAALPPPVPKRNKKRKKGGGLQQQLTPLPPPPAPVPVAVQYLSFFQYAPLAAAGLEDVRALFMSQLEALGCRGRIYLSVEGINAQMTAPLQAMMQLRAIVDTMAGGAFRGVEFTLGEIQTQEPPRPLVAGRGGKLQPMPQQSQQPYQKGVSPFHTLHVRIRQRLVNDGLTAEEHAALNLTDHGDQLLPSEWHAQLSANPAATLFDVRNFYESEIGHFAGAVPLDTATYLESFRKIDQLLAEREQKDPAAKDAPIFAYCTGGIRCIKVGAYLRSKGHQNIKLLRGGINAYANFIREAREQVASAAAAASTTGADPASISAAPEPIWKGKNFVFDSRMESGSPAESTRLSPEVISSCAFCGSPHDAHANCRNSRCHALFLQCPSCAEKMEHTCSDACKHVVQSIVNQKVHSYAEVPHATGYQFRPRVTWEETKKARAKAAAAAAGAPGMQSAKFSTLARSSPPRNSGMQHRGFATLAERSDMMAVPLDTAIAAYCVAHSTPADNAALLQRIADRTDAAMPDRSQMLSDPLVGLLLRCLARASLSGVAAPRFLEIGAFTGYSAGWLMETMRDMNCSGSAAAAQRPTVLSLEVSEEYAQICRANIREHPFYEQHRLVTGPALESLQAIADERAPSAYDLIFLDANKKQYPAYVDLILRSNLLKLNGLLVIDNTLWKGRVLIDIEAQGDDDTAAASSAVAASTSTRPPDSMTRSMQAFNRSLVSNPTLLVTMLPIRDGVTIVQWRQARSS